MKKTFRLISVDKKEQKYLKQFNINSLEKLSLDQGNQFFIKIIQDFKNYKLTLDELSVFSDRIFHGVAKNKKEKSDLFFISLSVAELSFMVRNKATYQNIPSCLKDIDVFLDKYGDKKQIF